MKRILAMMLALMCMLCACGETEIAIGQSFHDTRAAEDAYGVYYSVKGENHGLYFYDKSTGEITRVDDCYGNVVLIGDTLVIGDVVQPGPGDVNIYTIPAAVFRERLADWRDAAEVHENFSWSSDIAVYGERLAFRNAWAIGEIASADASLENTERFYDTNRVLCGYEDGEYYYMHVTPVDEREGYVKLTLCREDTPLFVFSECWAGSVSFNDYCAVAGGYLYYYYDNLVCRRKLSRYSRMEVLWDGFTGAFNTRRSLTVENGKITHIISRYGLMDYSRMNFRAVAADGVYLHQSGGFTRVAPDGSGAVRCLHSFNQNNACFVSAVDGKYKYACAEGVFIVE